MKTTLMALTFAACGTVLVAARSPLVAARSPLVAARSPLVAAQGGAAAPGPAAAGVPVLRVQKNVSMLVTGGANVTVQAGDDGVLLVDTGAAGLTPGIVAAVRSVSPRPIHTIINTHLDADHTGGNQAFLKLRGAQPVRVMGHENTFNRMIEAAAAANSNIPRDSLPTNTYFTPTRDFFLNGEAIVLHHVEGHTDGDTLVHFRGSDVVSTGDVFSPDRYPSIDLAKGGSVNGLIAALNRVLEITVPARYQEGGTYVIPGHGRLCDEADVVEYRDMVTIVRDRIQELMKKKMTLAQVKAARPSLDYDGEYGNPDAFIDAAFRSLGGT
jgi:glyoxylase-like metal-dependent hydrolase (beta-lactamase superfamily II)